MALYDSVTRAGDFVARFNGEEFVALLPATSRLELRHVAEGMRVAVESLDIPHGAVPGFPRLTVSVGGVSLQPYLSLDPKRLIERVEQQLSIAKQSGRNRVSIASD
jgi:diguanylate cyclase (GGDEF)-like protein